MYNNYMNPYSNYWISVNEVSLLEAMNIAWIEHILWTRLLLISIAENLNDLDSTRNRLLQNPKKIADIFRIYYGDKIGSEIQDLLTEHLQIGEKLIVALKNNNQTLARTLNDEWYKNADKMADAFSSINPFYPKEQIRKMLYDHLKFTSDEVSARLKKDYVVDIKAYDMVQKEILNMSYFFVHGIVNQFPNMF